VEQGDHEALINREQGVYKNLSGLQLV
jgi:hypothetical protein